MKRAASSDTDSSSSGWTTVQAPSIVSRGTDEADLLALCYGSSVVLRVCTGKFVAIAEAVPASSTAPAQPRRVHAASPSSWCAFTLLHADAPTSTAEVQFQHSVAFLAADGTFLSAEGEATGGGSNNEDGDAPLGAFRRNIDDVRCKWTLLSGQAAMIALPPSGRAAPFHRARGGVKIFDRVLLRGARLGFVGVEEADLSGSLRHNVPATQVAASCVLQMARANLPIAPDWLKQRGGSLSLSPPGLDVLASQSDPRASSSFHTLPPELQEQLLLEDVLFALVAIEGKYIRMLNPESESQQQQQQAQQTPTRVQFVVSPLVRDASLVELVGRLLPAGGAYFSVQSFVQSRSRWEYGLVSHALSASLRAILQEYLVLVAQLEHQFASRKLTLLRAWYYLQPALHSLTRLEHLCSQASHARGGALLGVLHRAWSCAGDAASRGLYGSLLSAGCVPYFSMLSSWLTQGVLADPYEEFMVRGDLGLRKENLRRDFNDTYWDERYTIRKAMMPDFLAPLSDRILTTGKYLNVIRECGRTIPAQAVAEAANGSSNGSSDSGSSGSGSNPVGPLLSYSPNDRAYIDPIDRLYSFASRLLLDLLMGECDLPGRLRSIKRFFLFAQGDFYTHFLDLVGVELSKRVGEVAVSKVKALMDLAMRTTKALQDPYHEDFSCHLQQYSLVQKLEAIHNTAAGATGAAGAAGVGLLAPSPSSSLHGFDSLTLGYAVGWPLSLVLSKKTLTKYQLMFRHLLTIRHTERLLHTTWRNHQAAKGMELGRAYHASFALRHRMLHLFHSLAYYMMAEVLEPAWHRLELALCGVATVDEVLKLHAGFLDGCLKACLLTNQSLLKSMQKLIVTARHYAEHAELTMNSGSAASATAAAGWKRSDSDDEDSIRPRHRRTGSLEDASSGVDARHVQVAPSLQQRADAIAFNTRVTLAAIADSRHQATIAAHSRAFDDNLFALLTQLKAKSQQGSDAHFSNLYQRLDYNGWYQSYFQANQTNKQQQQQQQRQHKQIAPQTTRK